MPLFQKAKKSSVIFISLILFQLILISIQVPLGEEPSYFEKAIFFIFSPIQKGITSFLQVMGNLWNRYVNLRDVQAQNQIMKEELFMLRQENHLLRTALQKLQEKKEVEEYLGKIHQSFLLASVTGLDSLNVYKSLVINKGSLQGVKKNMVILDKFGNLVGRIIEPISLNEATVQLITDEQSGVGVYSQNQKVLAVLSGDARGRCLLKYILATDMNVTEDEELITSGLDKIFPSGIKVGKIVFITVENSLFKRVVVKPYFNFNDLSPVAVLTQKTDELF